MGLAPLYSDDQSLHITQFNAEIEFRYLTFLDQSLACFELNVIFSPVLGLRPSR